ncbi:MAG: dTDP-4-dehydrorhamnose reductase [Oscillospiraceae bacterium]|jgi:dTDP-4-dehydrorhamnose reductase|nr:dTDP-4-dehydrorhamnose reductase [Oscillospiraceae bacterium]
MKIMVTGAAGQLGHDVTAELSRRGIEKLGVDLADFDITDSAAVLSAIFAYRPDTVIHCAAYTAVDKAEDNRELCRAINVDGTRNIAAACKQIGAALMYISTDYVFGGEGDLPFETGSPRGAQSFYGLTKQQGEDEITALISNYFIVRISWVFGRCGANFVKTMLRLAEKGEVNVVCDQIGSPTYTPDLSALLCDMIVTEQYGVYHATNEGFCSWAEFAEEIFRRAGKTVKVNHIASEDYLTRAVRPKNSRLSKKSLDAAGFKRLRPWQEALAHYLAANAVCEP